MKTPRIKAVFNWSGGKDSALALYKIQQEKEFEVISLLTTVDQKSHQSSLHAIPTSLLLQQAESIGIPIHLVYLPDNGTMESYEATFSKAIEPYIQTGIKHFIFGDIFLQEVKSYRENQLKPYGIEVIEPLWGRSSEAVMEDFLESGLQTVIVTTQADKLDESYIGRILDRNLINALPAEVDVCGENGEYHTFCYDGRIFQFPISFALGNPIKKTFLQKQEDGAEKTNSYWFARWEQNQEKDLLKNQTLK